MGSPAADTEIDADLVYRLLDEQRPDLALLPIHLLDAGWDNVMFRLGDCLSVRLPRRKEAASLIVNEQTWLPLLAGRLPLPVPAPLWAGSPGFGYPYRWSVLPWLEGQPADLAEPDAGEALRLGAFLRALHRPAPGDAPPNPVRGVPLRRRKGAVEARFKGLEARADFAAIAGLVEGRIREIWQTALEAPIDTPPRWLHGDLHARNVLVQDGAISGILDWGDMTAGDIATDLAALWMLFPDRQAREAALTEYGGVSVATRQRARGWAVLFGVMLLETGLKDSPRHALMGRRALERLQGDL